MKFDYKMKVNIKNIIQIIVGVNNKKINDSHRKNKTFSKKTPLINEFY